MKAHIISALHSGITTLALQKYAAMRAVSSGILLALESRVEDNLLHLRWTFELVKGGVGLKLLNGA